MFNEDKDEPNAEMMVRAVSFQEGVYEPIAIGHNCGKVGVLYRALKQDLAPLPLDLTPPSEDGFHIGKAGLLGIQSVGWMGGDFECHWHGGEY